MTSYINFNASKPAGDRQVAAHLLPSTLVGRSPARPASRSTAPRPRLHPPRVRCGQPERRRPTALARSAPTTRQRAERLAAFTASPRPKGAQAIVTCVRKWKPQARPRSKALFSFVKNFKIFRQIESCGTCIRY